MSMGAMAVGRDGAHVFRVAAHRQDSAGDFRMHGLTRPSSISGKPVISLTSFTGIPWSRSCGGAAGGNELGAHGGEGAGKSTISGFVGDADQDACDFRHLQAR